MKRLTIPAIALLVACLLVLPALAERTDKNKGPRIPADNAPRHSTQGEGKTRPADQGKGNNAPAVAGQLAPEQLQGDPGETPVDPHQSEAFKRQQDYRQKREAMKQRRDEALKVREQNTN